MLRLNRAQTLQTRRIALAVTASLALTALVPGGGAGVAHAQTTNFTTVASFSLNNGAEPFGGVTLDSSGNIYGTTDGGGANEDGTVFKIAAGTTNITTLATFNGNNGAFPQTGVTIDSSGNLYGTTSGGLGSIFKIAAGTNTLTTVVSFNGNNGAPPFGGVTLDSSGDLYGTTYYGGTGQVGNVFEIAAGTNTVTTLASFNGNNGAYPQAGVTLDSSGNLYGTTGGGTINDGTVFKIAAGTNTLTTLASFTGSNGASPSAGVTLDSSGNLYGTTQQGGANNDGTVFEIAAGTNTVTTLASFNGSNGLNPIAGITLDSSGNLYGTTYAGGANNDGTVFEIAAGTNTITTLTSFDGSNGVKPVGGITLDGSGNLYGTTSGGTSSNGNVFKISIITSFDYTGNGSTGSTGAPITGNFSTGFGFTLTTGNTILPLTFGGNNSASYTATDDLNSAVTVTGLTFSNTGAVTLARGTNSGAINQIALTTNTSTGANPTLTLNNSGAVTVNPDLVLNATTTVTGTGSATIAGAISGTSGLTMNGAGTLTLTGKNSYSGTTTVDSGTLALGYNGNEGTIQNSNIVINGGTVLVQAANSLFGSASSSPRTVTLNVGGVLTTASGVTTQLYGTTLNGGTLASNATVDPNNGSYSLNNYYTLSATANSTITATNMHLASLSSVNVASGVTLTDSGTFSDTRANSTQLTKTGAGTLLLTGSNTYSGGTTISAGTLQLGDGTTTNGSIAGTVMDNANLTFANPNAEASTLLIRGTGSVTKIGAGTLTLTNSSNYSGGTTISGGTVAVGSNTALGSGTVTVSGGTLAAANQTTLSNAVTLGSMASLSSGTFTTGSVHTPGLALAGSVTLNSPTYSTSLNVTGTSRVAITRAIGETSGQATALVKSGAGTLELDKDNTYSGGTLVAAGTLIVNNNYVAGGFTASGSGTGQGAVTVANGATLTGAYVISGPVQVNSGGTLAVGNSIGVGSVGSMNLAGGSLLDFELGTDGMTSDRVNVVGLLSYSGSGGIDFDLTGEHLADGTVNPISAGTFTLLTFGAANGLSASDFFATSLPQGWSYAFSMTNSNGSGSSFQPGTLNVTVTSSDAAPEPEALLLCLPGACLGFAGGLRMRRRRDARTITASTTAQNDRTHQ